MEQEQCVVCVLLQDGCFQGVIWRRGKDGEIDAGVKKTRLGQIEKLQREWKKDWCRGSDVPSSSKFASTWEWNTKRQWLEDEIDTQPQLWKEHMIS